MFFLSSGHIPIFLEHASAIMFEKALPEYVNKIVSEYIKEIFFRISRCYLNGDNNSYEEQWVVPGSE